MMLALVPLFDEEIAVRAYSVFSRKDNFLLDPMMLGTRQNDGAAVVDGLELIEDMGIETLSEDREIFVPLSNISVFSDVEAQCNVPHGRLVFLIDNTIPPIGMYVDRLRELKEKGYKLAVRKLGMADFEDYGEILKLADYVFLNYQKTAIDKAKIYLGKHYPDIRLCAGNIDNKEIFEELKASGGYALYEGSFYRVPVTKGDHQVTPLKANYVGLLNMVNSGSFDPEEAADIIRRDTALAISLLRLAGHTATADSSVTTIRRAVSVLGQKEMKKWVNTAVASALYAEKPGGLTRLSLLRAKFAECLAVPFGLQEKAEELFLMGLFSVLDVILEAPMAEALQTVMVAGDVREALAEGKGILAPVLELMTQYETANWQEVSRQLLLAGIPVQSVSDAYQRALRWYNKDVFEPLRTC